MFWYTYITSTCLYLLTTTVVLYPTHELFKVMLNSYGIIRLKWKL